MAKKKPVLDPFQTPLQNTPSTGGLVSLSGAGDPTLSKDYTDRAAQLYKSASDQYNTGSFAARHPYLDAGLGALAGLVLAGPGAALTVPMGLASRESKRKDSVIEAYQNGIKSLSEQEKNLNEPRMAANRGHGMNTLLQNQGIQSPLDDYSAIDAESQKNLLNGITGQDTYQNGLNDQNNTLNRTWNHFKPIAADMINQAKQSKGETQNALQQPAELDQSGPTLSAGVEHEQQIHLRPAVYNNPELLQTGLTANAAILNNTFQNIPAWMRMPSDIKEKMAQAALTDAQTKTEQQRPALIRGQTNDANAGAHLKSITNPNLRAPNVIDLMTPQQRQQYAGTVAAGRQGQYNPQDALAEVQLSNIVNDTTGKVSPQVKAAAAQALTHLRSANPGPAGQQPASVPSGNPVTLSSGRKFIP